MSDQSDQPGSGPATPSPSASVVLRPLGQGGVRFTSGLLHQWQQRNRSASLPLALRQLETAGTLANLRRAISRDGTGYQGPAFMDSDLYKTLEAIAWENGRAPSQPLAGFAAQATELLATAQQPDGYLNSYVQVTGKPRYANLAFSHELYCAGHLIQAAVAAQRGQAGGGAEQSGQAGGGAEQSGLFGVARRFADHLVKEFLGTHDGLDGHPIVETALVELYRETGHDPYLRLATQFVDQRGHGLIGDSGFGSRYLQDHLPVREANQVSGHAVRALYLEAGVVDVATETGDTELLAGSAVRWDDMVSAKTCLTGGVGSRHAGESFGDRFESPPDRAYNETCAAIASFPVELAAAAGHRRQQVRRPDGAGALQRFRRRHRHRGRPVLLRQPAAAAPGSLRRRRSGPPPPLVHLRLLPAQHHAAGRIPGALRRDHCRRRAAHPPLHRGAGRRRAGRWHLRPGHGDQLPLVRHGHPAGDQCPGGRLR